MTARYACGADYALSVGSGAAELIGPLLLNEAQCRLKLGEAAAAAALCSRALQREPGSAKALYRRALARMGLRDFGDALRDLSAAARLEPSNREVRSRLEVRAYRHKPLHAVTYRYIPLQTAR